MSHPPADDCPELPALTAGVQLLTGECRLAGPLQTLVLDHLLRTDGEAVWIDAGGHAVTQSLARLAPNERTLDRIQVARGFTAYQHHALTDRLTDVVDDATTLVVAPAFDRPYRDDCRASQGAELRLRSLATLARVARERTIPVLVTRATDDGFAAPLAAAADDTLRVEGTPHGPRFVGDEFETLEYPPAADGSAQTTLAYWVRILAARHAGAADEPTERNTVSVAATGGR